MAPHTDPPGDSIDRAISAAVSRLYLDKFGKGPLHAETHRNGDVAVTLLRDVFTEAEKAMVEAGRGDSVLVTRMHWQSATDPMFKAAVEKVTGRRVLAAISGFQLDEELATEVFLLAPTVS